jgi:lysosomal acid lipase/cholesteryl ester hydrolase
MNGKKNSVGFAIADAGYDVWAVNFRGNKHSRRHIYLDADKDLEYWEKAGMIEIAKFDVPAFIEHIKRETGVKNVTVVAHSMGSQEILYNLATNASYYTANINGMYALGPIGKNTKIDMAMNRIFASSAYHMDKLGLISILGMTEFYKAEAFFFGYGFKYVCGYVPSFCEWAMTFIAQTTNEFNDKERMKVFFSHYPAGSSYKAWSYIWYIFLDQKLKEIDLGSAEKNLEAYG